MISKTSLRGPFVRWYASRIIAGKRLRYRSAASAVHTYGQLNKDIAGRLTGNSQAAAGLWSNFFRKGQIFS